MNSDEHNSNDDQSSGQFASKANQYTDDIPVLTQQIPVVEQEIPVVEQQIPELHEVVPDRGVIIPPHTSVSEVTIDQLPDFDDPVSPAVPSEDVQNEARAILLPDQVSDNELQQQQWQIEQQALAQRGDWQTLAEIESIQTQADHDPSADTVSATATVDDVRLNDEQQLALQASWERLEALIMDNMPVEIAGIYLTILEQNLQSAQQDIAREIALLEQADLDSILDFYQIERGF